MMQQSLAKQGIVTVGYSVWPVIIVLCFCLIREAYNALLHLFPFFLGLKSFFYADCSAHLQYKFIHYRRKKIKKKRGVKSKLDSDETNLCCKKLVNFCHFPGPWDDASYSERRSSRTCRQYFVLWPPYLYASWIRRYLDHTCTLGKRCLHILSKMENKQMLKY